MEGLTYTRTVVRHMQSMPEFLSLKFKYFCLSLVHKEIPHAKKCVQSHAEIVLETLEMGSTESDVLQKIGITRAQSMHVQNTHTHTHTHIYI